MTSYAERKWLIWHPKASSNQTEHVTADGPADYELPYGDSMGRTLRITSIEDGGAAAGSGTDSNPVVIGDGVVIPLPKRTGWRSRLQAIPEPVSLQTSQKTMV
jgi:O-phosphoseryl-tRNA(Cys) synthetase